MARRRLTGAALYQKVESLIRADFTNNYGLPMWKYTATVSAHSIGSDIQPILDITFTNKETGAMIKVTEIHPANDGTIDIYGSNYGHLAY